MALRVDVITLFPEALEGLLASSILGRAVAEGRLEVVRTNLRDFALDARGTVDDKPFGGGPGMVLRCEPVFAAVEAVRGRDARPGRVVLLTPQGRRLDQARVRQLAACDRLIRVCGHYEGFDERIRTLADEELSIGDYVVTGGELPALVVIDAVARLLPGVLGAEDGTHEESFSPGTTAGGLEYPQYTRPREFRGMRVPEVLVSGNHAEIARWRARQARHRTRRRRPDLPAPEEQDDNHA
jgi:tRNA (guanine37-N1)-methyltransferase